MNNITIELCAEDRARLDGILDRLLNLQVIVGYSEQVREAERLKDEAPAPVEPAPVEPAPVEPAPVEPAPVEPAPVETAPAYTTEDVQALIRELIGPENPDEVKAAAKKVVMSYAEKVSKIPADKIPEAYQRLSALKEGLKHGA